MEYQKLDELISELQDMIEETSPQKGYWKQLWSLVNQIRVAFKETRYPEKEDKNKAYGVYESLLKQAETRKIENQKLIEERNLRFEERKRQSEERERHSEQTKDVIERMVAGARPLSGFERGIADIFLLPAKLVTRIALSILNIETKTELEEIHDELKNCSQCLKDAWSEFSNSKDTMLPGDKSQIYQTLINAKEQLDIAWGDWKSAKNEFNESQQRDWEARQHERDIKHQQFIDRVQENIIKLENKLDKAQNALSHQEEHLDKLRDDYDNAWNDGFKDRCSEWIDECENKIISIKEHIERLEDWLDEERGKLD